MNTEQIQVALQLASKKYRPEVIASTMTRKFHKTFTAL